MTLPPRPAERQAAGGANPPRARPHPFRGRGAADVLEENATSRRAQPRPNRATPRQHAPQQAGVRQFSDAAGGGGRPPFRTHGSCLRHTRERGWAAPTWPLVVRHPTDGCLRLAPGAPGLRPAPTPRTRCRDTWELAEPLSLAALRSVKKPGVSAREHAPSRPLQRPAPSHTAGHALERRPPCLTIGHRHAPYDGEHGRADPPGALSDATRMASSIGRVLSQRPCPAQPTAEAAGSGHGSPSGERCPLAPEHRHPHAPWE